MNSSFSIYSSLEVRHAGRCFIGQRCKFGIANLDFSFLLAECAEQTATSRTSTFDSPDTENEFKPVSNSSRHHLIDDHPDILVDVIQEASGVCSTVPESSEVKSVQRSHGSRLHTFQHTPQSSQQYRRLEFQVELLAIRGSRISWLAHGCRVSFINPFYISRRLHDVSGLSRVV